MSLSPLLIISIFFASLYLVMVMYFLLGWLRLKKTEVSAQESKDEQPFVSVVIPTRNESQSIKACLESIFKQRYPKHLFEIIVVDDYSTDPTIRLAREVNEPNLMVIDLMQYLGNKGEYVPNKKKALALGIKNAKGELIITTDGDGVVGENWLSSMVTAFQQSGCKLLTGPVMMKPAYWPIEIFQQLDVMNLIGITGATIRNGTPMMSNGANLMYAKQTFLDVEGFKGNHDIPTGDDIFLMHKINERFPDAIGFVKNFDACVFTKPERSWGGFISQRIRWISKCTDFSNRPVTFTLYFAYLFNAMIVVTAVLAFPLSKDSWWPLAVVGGTKVFADLIFNIPITVFFKKIILLLVFPIVEIFHVLYVIVIGLLSLRGKYRWKDRLVR